MNIKEVVKENLISLRKSHQLTQLELSEKICYSDKAISRWENGEVTPDIETLESLAHLYEVPIAYFFDKHNGVNAVKNDKQLANKILACIVSVMTVWTMVTILFVYLQTLKDIIFWQGFIWAVPISCLVLAWYNHKWFKNKTLNFIMWTVLLWSLLASIYLQFISYNVYLIFVIGIPMQVSFIATYCLKSH